MIQTTRQPVSVGEMLQLEYMEPLGLTSEVLADAMKVDQKVIEGLISGDSLTAPLSMRLAAALGTSPDFWLNIQHACNLWHAEYNYEIETTQVKRLTSK